MEHIYNVSQSKNCQFHKTTTVLTIFKNKKSSLLKFNYIVEAIQNSFGLVLSSQKNSHSVTHCQALGHLIIKPL